MYIKTEFCRETYTKTGFCRETYTKMEVCRETYTKTGTRKETCNGYQASPGNESAWTESPNTKTSLVDAAKTVQSKGAECSNVSAKGVSDCVQNKVGGSGVIRGFFAMFVAIAIVFVWNSFVPSAQMNIADGTTLIVNMGQLFDDMLVAMGHVNVSCRRMYPRNQK